MDLIVYDWSVAYIVKFIKYIYTGFSDGNKSLIMDDNIYY